jgi:hypothetical protein
LLFCFFLLGPETKGNVLINNAEELLKFSSSEEKEIEKEIKAIADMGVGAIVTGSSIDEMSLHYIEKYKLLALKISSQHDLRRLCRATKAKPMVTMVRNLLAFFLFFFFLTLLLCSSLPDCSYEGLHRFLQFYFCQRSRFFKDVRIFVFFHAAFLPFSFSPSLSLPFFPSCVFSQDSKDSTQLATILLRASTHNNLNDLERAIGLFPAVVLFWH